MLVPLNLYIAGKFTDRAELRQKNKTRPFICMITSLIPVPFFYIMYTTDLFWLSMVCLFIVYLIGETYISISVAMIINVTTPRVRALRNLHTENALLLGTSFAGASVSAILLGFADSNHTSLRIGLISVVPSAYFIGAILFCFLIRIYPRDLEKESGQDGLINNLD